MQDFSQGELAMLQCAIDTAIKTHDANIKKGGSVTYIAVQRKLLKEYGDLRERVRHARKWDRG